MSRIDLALERVLEKLREESVLVWLFCILLRVRIDV